MIKVTDYIAKRLKEYGVEQVFMVTGGGAMHLNDSLGRALNYVCFHNEQGAAIAAEGYSRISGKLGVINVTTGPGGLNTLTGVMGQWTDSVPALYISGQIKFETTIYSCPEVKGLRQLGDQEVDIARVVSPITKFSVMITDPNDIRYLLEKAIYIATEGRPGPVWIDVPMNIQGAMVDETNLRGFEPPKKERNDISETVKIVADKIRNAKRPVILAGHGVRIAKGTEALEALLAECDIPVATTFNGMDVIQDGHKNYIGRFGTYGNRPGNFTVQNADVLICIGTRNNIRQITYAWDLFAREAYKIIVDIDPAELQKPTVKPDLPVCTDAREFIEALKTELSGSIKGKHAEWLDWCQVRKKKYPPVMPEYYQMPEGFANAYVFMDVLGKCIPDGGACVSGDGTACIVTFQALPITHKYRYIHNNGCASMGYDISAAIGACVARGRKDTVCLAGDGSLQMNIQELQTIIYHQFPIKLFYLNNDGYLSIKQTQDGFFNGHRVGTDPGSGVSFPDIIKLAHAYGFKTHRITSNEGLKEQIEFVLSQEGPIICEVMFPGDYKFLPKVSSRRLEDGRMVTAPLEDMAPFLDRDELRSNLFIKEYTG